MVSQISLKVKIINIYAKAKVINVEYSYYLNPTLDHDWSLVELDRNIGNDIGWFGITHDYYGGATANINSFGYPGINHTMWETNGHITGYYDYRHRTDVDTEGGQSGSPYIATIASNNYVCGIHTHGSTSGNYNGGTKVNILMYYYIGSFFFNRNDNRNYFYLVFEDLSKSGNTWNMTLRSKEGRYITAYYNKKMCFENDGKNWRNLNDIAELVMMPYQSRNISIKENWFADAIVASYIDNVPQRILTVGTSLSTSGSLNTFVDEISL